MVYEFGLTYFLRSDDENSAIDGAVDIVSDDGVAGALMYIIVCCGKRVEDAGPLTREKKENDWKKKSKTFSGGLSRRELHGVQV